MTWKVTREVPGVVSGGLETDWCNLWRTEREYWSKPRWDKEQMIR